MKVILLLFCFIALSLGSEIILQKWEEFEGKNPNNNTIFLIRHGEKPDDDDQNGLSDKGLKRAQCLRKVFGASSKYGIKKIMAMKPKSDGKEQRPYDTVKPLADDLRMKVDISCKRDDGDCVHDVVKQWNEGSVRGNILICWEHKALTDIASALKVDNPPTYPSGRFDIIWIDSDKKITFGSERCPGLDPTA
eukprot:TRINITY_DN2782_c0_g1_i1.p1 TRINITY_DN2782_c0_g1~~TRINITY_DN2782_c0_g1_i1.p1  ORF type:complete len:192 (+),score=58.26 TRINITY_DN2782_c0_g1_i1:332-907(+)